MAGPWEKYAASGQATQSAQGPWANYQAPPTTVQPPAPPPSPQPGFLTRLGQSLGVPTSQAELEQLKSAAPSTAEILLGPAATAAKVVGNVASATKQGLSNAYQEGKEAIANIQQNPSLPNINANIGKAGYGLEKGILEGPLSILGGKSVQQVGEDVAAKNYAGAAGGALGVEAQAALMGLGGKRSTQTRANKLSYAIGARGAAADYPEAIKTALPELDRAAQVVGKPSTPAQLQQVVKEAFRTTENEYNTALQPLAGQPVAGTPIADAIRNEASKLNPKMANERRMIAMLRGRATEFDQPWTYGELNQARMNANARLRAFSNSDISAQAATLRTKVDAMVDKIIADNSRDMVYSAMQQHWGQDFAALKQRQSALTIVQDQLRDHVNELMNETATTKGAPLLSGENVSVYGHPTGGIGASIHRLQRLVIPPDAAASSAVRGAFTQPSGALPRVALGVSAAARAFQSPTDVMMAAKNGEISPADADRLIKQMGGRKEVRKPAPLP